MKNFLISACKLFSQAISAHLLSKISELFVYFSADQVTRRLTGLIHDLPPGTQLKVKIISNCLEIEVVLPG